MGRIILIDRDMVDADQIMHYFISRNEELIINRLEDIDAVSHYFLQRDPNQVTQFNHPSFVLIDVDFPNALNGMEIIKQFKTHPSFKHIPLFVFTKNSDKHIIAQCFVIGANGYFLKPTNHFSFNSSIKQLVERWKNLSQSGFGYNYRAV